MRILENIFCINTSRYFKYLLLFFVLGTFQSLAQNKIDSLENLLKNNLPDSSRTKVLVALSSAYEFVDLAKSRALSDEAVSLAENSNLPGLKGLAYRSMASVYRVSGDYSSSLKLDNMSLESSILSKDSSMIASAYNNVAHDYHDLGEYDESYYYFTQGYKFAQAAKDSFVMAVTIHNVGRVFKELGQYNRALDHLQISQRMSRQIKDREGEPYSLDEIGDVLLRQGNYDSALTTLFAALKEGRKLQLTWTAS